MLKNFAISLFIFLTFLSGCSTKQVPSSTIYFNDVLIENQYLTGQDTIIVHPEWASSRRTPAFPFVTADIDHTNMPLAPDSSTTMK